MSIGRLPSIYAAAWRAQRTQITGRWPEVLTDLDLDFYEDEMACDHEPRPSLAVLADRWGMHRASVARRIEGWKVRVAMRPGATPARHLRDSRPREILDNGDDARHLRDSGETPLLRARASSSPYKEPPIAPQGAGQVLPFAQEPPPPPPPKPKKKRRVYPDHRPEFDHVWQAFRAVRTLMREEDLRVGPPEKRTRVGMPGARPAGEARQLLDDLFADGVTPAEAILVCEWMHLSPDGLWWRDRKRLTATTMWKRTRWPNRYDQASHWDAAGRPRTDEQADARRHPDVDTVVRSRRRSAARPPPRSTS